MKLANVNTMFRKEDKNANVEVNYTCPICGQRYVIPYSQAKEKFRCFMCGNTQRARELTQKEKMGNTLAVIGDCFAFGAPIIMLIALIIKIYL